LTGNVDVSNGRCLSVSSATNDDDVGGGGGGDCVRFNV